MTRTKARVGRSPRYVRQQKQQRRTLWIAGGIVLAALLIGGLFLTLGGGAVAAPGQSVAVQSRDHIADGATHPPYNSDPPTSGPHYAEPAPAGFYEQPIPDERLVHNLEHGHVVISYDCTKLTNCDAVKTQLHDVYNKYKGWKVVVVPRKNADTPLALTAWGRIDKMADFDGRRIDAFINAYRDKGPEQTPD